MTPYPVSVAALARRPSGFIPVLMSLGALGVVIVSIATGGAVRQADEGAAAHLFQLLIVAELPLLAFFIARRLRQNVWAVLTVSAIQAAALGLALFPVWYFGL